MRDRYDIAVCGAGMAGRTIRTAMLHNRSLSAEVEAKAFIDASGEGILARYAGEKIEYSVWEEPNGKVGLKLKLFHMDLDTGSGEGYNRAVMEMRARIPEFVRHFQEHHDSSYIFDYASPMLGLREGLPPYQIPYGSLVPKAIDNCLLAGRCLSADRLALSSARVMPTCCMMGQAAGIAAAIAADAGTDVRSVDTKQVRAGILRDTPDPELVRERFSCP